MTRTPPSPDPRVRAALRRGTEAWFHLGSVRNEVLGEQPDGAPATRSSADVYLYEAIGGWIGMTADDFVRDVAGLDVDHIDLHLNSPGGDAFEGVAIANVLRGHRADVTVWVDGIAASAASVVAMAGDEVVMNVGSQLMIHDASIVAFGDAAAMQRVLNRLNSSSNTLAATYAEKAGGTAAEWREVMIAETWYTAEEAVAAGLADRVATPADRGQASGEQIVPGSSSGMWDLWDRLSDADRHTEALQALYAYAGREAAPAPRMPGRTPQTPAASAGGSTSTQEEATMPDLIEALRQRLGIADDADEATALAALDETLAEHAEPAPALPAGVVAVEASVLADLRAAATEGRAARDQQRVEHRERIVAAAVADGRIAPARRDYWLTAMVADTEGTEQTLAGLQPGLIPVAEVGHAANDSTDAVALENELDALAVAAGLPKGSLQ